MDRGAWWATVHGVTQSQTQLSDLACTHASPKIGASLLLQLSFVVKRSDVLWVYRETDLWSYRAAWRGNLTARQMAH